MLGLLFSAGCQIDQRSTEIRTDEQMLEVTFENDRARDLFNGIVHNTERTSSRTGGIGIGPVSAGVRQEKLSFNAHCNELIRKVDVNGDLVITQREAEDYYNLIRN